MAFGYYNGTPVHVGFVGDVFFLLGYAVDVNHAALLLNHISTNGYDALDQFSSGCLQDNDFAPPRFPKTVLYLFYEYAFTIIERIFHRYPVYSKRLNDEDNNQGCPEGRVDKWQNPFFP